MSRSITLRRPDDWHLHLRDGEELRAVVGFTVQRFARAIVMPNLQPPVTTVAAARAYRQRILDAAGPDSSFQPLMTLYLTEDLQASEIEAARASGFIHGVKLYPAGATTHSEAGVRMLQRVYGVLEQMQSAGMPLLVHGEVTDPSVDVFDREERFIDKVLEPLLRRYAQLKVVLEHITTRAAVQFVRGERTGVAATITPQHLLLNRNALFAGGLRPHHYCLPVLKTESDREAVLTAATSGDPRFFLGTDSAPHARSTKETACGCAGMFSAHAAIELYAEAFESAAALERLQGFASEFGADFYGLPRNNSAITLTREEWRVPQTLPFGPGQLVPFRAGESMPWRLESAGT
ncbi:MAG TPA: dihydroorotase [Steroidobacteraceae bacterium]|nr:dihydroorotase [Steroidobacteraceae bacterium]